MKKCGYFGIGIYQPKTIENVGTLWRSAWNFNASFIFTIGRRYKKQCSDTQHTYKYIPLYHYKDWEDFNDHRPLDAFLVGVEIVPEAIELKDYKHFERAIYLLGAEENGLPKEIINKCQSIIKFNTPRSLNVAVAGSIVMYDRIVKANS